MKRFSKKQSDQLVAELVSITFDIKGLDTDLEKLHTGCIRSVEMLWNLNRTKAVDKYIRLHLPHTIHQTLMLSIIEGGLSIESSKEFILRSIEFLDPTLDELGIY